MEPKNRSNLEFQVQKIRQKIIELEQQVESSQQLISFFKDMEDALDLEIENSKGKQNIFVSALEILKKNPGPNHISSILYRLLKEKNKDVHRKTLESMLVKGLKDPECEYIRPEKGIYQIKNIDEENELDEI
jgi:hypothetical protein